MTAPTEKLCPLFSMKETTSMVDNDLPTAVVIGMKLYAQPGSVNATCRPQPDTIHFQAIWTTITD